MQGTQYAPRESILCMEHFVALHPKSMDFFDKFTQILFLWQPFIISPDTSGVQGELEVYPCSVINNFKHLLLCNRFNKTKMAAIPIYGKNL